MLSSLQVLDPLKQFLQMRAQFKATDTCSAW